MAYEKLIKDLPVGDNKYKYFDLLGLDDDRYGENCPPFSLESPLDDKNVVSLEHQSRDDSKANCSGMLR